MSDCAVCGVKIEGHAHAGRPRILCRKTKCRSTYMHNYMTEWWSVAKQNKVPRKTKEINLDNFDFYGNNEAGIYFL
jgi:hypothetical protein